MYEIPLPVIPNNSFMVKPKVSGTENRVSSEGHPPGLAIRKLGNKLFECRGSLALRFIFQDRPTDLFVSFLGNHDEIKALLKSGKYR